jgi:DNA-binding LytR/AlgR family response regulator
MSDLSLSALIVDDEPMARAHLKRLLALHAVSVVGEAENAADAMALTKSLSPDVILLDIRLPGLSGLEFATALRAFDVDTQIIFVTAHPQYALDAFEHDAVDYLLKPVSTERFGTALSRARERVSVHKANRIVSADAVASSEVRKNSGRLSIQDEYAIRLVPFSEIIYATVRDRNTFVATPSREYRADYTLTQLEALLPGDLFFRIHSAWLVNLDRVEQVCFLGNHSYAARLTNNEQAPISRYRWARLKQRLGIDVNEAGYREV